MVYLAEEVTELMGAFHDHRQAATFFQPPDRSRRLSPQTTLSAPCSRPFSMTTANTLGQGESGEGR